MKLVCELLLIIMAQTMIAVMLSLLVDSLSISDLLGFYAFGFLVVSMTQNDIIRLRLFGACASLCFIVQFTMSDLPIINTIGQAGLFIYAIYKAVSEIKEKKNLI